MSNGEIIKFFSMIHLKVRNGAMEVGVHISIKEEKGGGEVGFRA